FNPDTISSAAQSVPYTPIIRFYGIENEAVFDTTDTLTQTVLVQDSADVQVIYIDIIPDTVSQNQDSIKAQIILQNVGSLNATAQIAKPDSILLNTTQMSEIEPADYELGLFPIVLAAGSSSDTIDFIYSLTPDYQTGTDTARVSYTFTDENSGTIYKTLPPNFDTVLVQPRGRLTLTNNSLDPDTVTQGQTGIQVRFTVMNTGEVQASIDSSDLMVQFNNSHPLTLTSPTAFPVLLAQTDTQQFIYNLDIAMNSSTGWDPYDLSVSHTDVRSGKR
ncbi:MAG: hypothetical protein GWN00_29300, partial [Aliifodinibius sp.]|nr:hypothetical protein [Fodinibius sp.]NIV14867.1 hypothetical protein [Fodinibius sp.]NIY28744.1 hypothetical protein [Fodinibius sp.]